MRNDPDVGMSTAAGIAGGLVGEALRKRNLEPILAEAATSATVARTTMPSTTVHPGLQDRLTRIMANPLARRRAAGRRQLIGLTQRHEHGQ